MKRIAVVGANSFIARNLIYILNRDYSDVELELYDCGEKQLDGLKNYKQIDVMSLESVMKINLDCDIIYVFVGKTGSKNGFDDYQTFINVNEIALLNILTAYRKQESGAKIVFPSTRLVYGHQNEAQSEENIGELKTVYAINKYACELYLKQYHMIFGVKYCIFRIGVPYGTLVENASSYGTAEFMIQNALDKKEIPIYGDGKQRRTVTYIGDLCRTMIIGAFDERCCNDVYNIGGEEYSIGEMARLIAKKYDASIRYIDWPVIDWKIESGDTVFNDSKLQNIIGNTTQSKFHDWVQ